MPWLECLVLHCGLLLLSFGHPKRTALGERTSASRYWPLSLSVLHPCARRCPQGHNMQPSQAFRHRGRVSVLCRSASPHLFNRSSSSFFRRSWNHRMIALLMAVTVSSDIAIRTAMTSRAAVAIVKLPGCSRHSSSKNHRRRHSRKHHRKRSCSSSRRRGDGSGCGRL